MEKIKNILDFMNYSNKEPQVLRSSSSSTSTSSFQQQVSRLVGVGVVQQQQLVKQFATQSHTSQCRRRSDMSIHTLVKLNYLLELLLHLYHQIQSWTIIITDLHILHPTCEIIHSLQDIVTKAFSVFSCCTLLFVPSSLQLRIRPIVNVTF